MTQVSHPFQLIELIAELSMVPVKLCLTVLETSCSLRTFGLKKPASLRPPMPFIGTERLWVKMAVDLRSADFFNPHSYIFGALTPYHTCV